MKKATLYLFLSVVCNIYMQAQPLARFDHIYPAKGLSNSVRYVLSDSRGFLWAATDEGLFRYDGYEFKMYNDEPLDSTDLTNGTIHRLMEDHKGNIWVATQHGGLNVINPRTDKITHYRPKKGDSSSLRGVYVWNLYQDKQKVVWVSTDGGGLNRFDSITNSFSHYIHDSSDVTTVSSNSVYSMFEDSRNRFWVGTANGLNLLDRATGKFTRYPSSEKTIQGKMIMPIHEPQAGVLWIGSFDGGITIWNTNNNTYSYIQAYDGKKGVISNNVVNEFLFQPGGNVWIATDDGLNDFNPNTQKSIVYRYAADNTRSLSANQVWSICYDHSGILWLGMYEGGGINKMVPRKAFEHYYHEQGNPNSLSGKITRSIYKDKNGVLWIGSSSEGLTRYNRQNGTYRHYTPQNSGINSNQVLCIHDNNDGTIWLGTWGGGINILDTATNKVSYILPTENINSLPDNRIQAILQAPDGAYWIATDASSICKYEPRKNRFVNFRHNPNDTTTLNWGGIQSQAMCFDKKGNLWLGSWGGLNYFDTQTGKVTRYNYYDDNPRSISDNRILSLYVSDSILWIGTYGGGLNKMNLHSGEIHYFLQKQGLLSNTIFAIKPDDDGYLWLSTSDGLSRFDPQREIFYNYSAEDGLQDNEFFWGAAYKAPDGELFFGGVNGVTAFYPKNIKSNSHVPPVLITGFKIFNQPVPVGTPDSPLQQDISYTRHIELSYKQYVISFEFVALDLTAPERNRYAYMMEGFDQDWIYTQQRDVTYMNLKPGTYTFRVRGSNNDGVWNNDGAAIEIVINPPFWATWWFRIGSITIIVLAAYSFYRIRINEIKRINQKLEQQVQIRTAELQNANMEITMKNSELEQQKEEISAQRDSIEVQNEILQTQSDIINQKNQDITDSIQYAGRLQRALMPPENIIHDIFAESFVMYRPRDIVSGDFLWCKHIDNKLYFTVADCTGHGVPGAVMSILGITLLNEIFSNTPPTTAAGVLEDLRRRVILSLRQTGHDAEPKDGIDMAFAIIDLQTNQLQYAGAYNPIIIIRDNNIIEIKANKMPIGIHFKEAQPFDNHLYDIQNNDCLYLFSDGYIDQFSETVGRKFLYKNFRQLLLDIHNLPMNEQKTALQNTLDRWRGKATQVDDILIVGIKVT